MSMKEMLITTQEVTIEQHKKFLLAKLDQQIDGLERMKENINQGWLPSYGEAASSTNMAEEALRYLTIIEQAMEIKKALELVKDA